MEIDIDREKLLDRPLKRTCLRDPIAMHTSLQNGAPERAPERTDRVDLEDEEYVNLSRSDHDNYGSLPSEAYRCGSSSGSDDLVDPQYKIFFQNLRVTGKLYELEVQVDVGTSILLKYEVEDQTHEGLTLEDLKSRTLKNAAETVRSLRNDVGREKDEVAASSRKENDKNRRITRNVSGREKESLQTTKAPATCKGICNLDRRNIGAQSANLGSNRAVRQSPRKLCPEVRQAPEHEEEICDQSNVALLNGAKDDGNILRVTSDNGKQAAKAATTSKRNRNMDKRKIVCPNQAIGRSPRILHPKVRQAPEHEAETCDERYIPLLNGSKKDVTILEFSSDNGKQTTKAAATSKRNCNLDTRNIEAQPTNLGSTQAIRQSSRLLHSEVGQALEHEEKTCDESSCEVEMLAEEDISKCEAFVTMKLSKDPITIDSKHSVDDPGSSSVTVFRKKLMGVLKMPYDMKEHEDLSQRVRHKRQKTVEKSLRQGRDFTSSLGQRCKSYLELYKDFAKQLKLVRGDHKRNLNLLRGFFFWLENVPKEGAFKPWLDPTCLEALPARAISRV